MYTPPFEITSKIIDLISNISENKVTQNVTVKVTVNQQKIINAINTNPYLTQKKYHC